MEECVMKKLLVSLYNFLSNMSPWVEVTMRHIYWHNQKLFKKYNPNKASETHAEATNLKYVDFEKVIEWLKGKGVGDGSLLLVHSSYDELECTGLSPEQIVDRLLALVGPTGTLCMPVIRRFKEDHKHENVNYDSLVCTYNVKKTMVTSGMIPWTLMHRPDAVISHHPLNPMCAVGSLAKEMMAHNLEGEYPPPHGPNSSWKYCVDHGAVVCWLGTEAVHHNTISHVAEEAYPNWRWNNQEWYRKRKFNIIDENKNVLYQEVYERKPEWGELRLAEKNEEKILTRKRLIQTENIDGLVRVGYMNVKPYMQFRLSEKRYKKGRPYYKFVWEKQ